MKFANVLIAVMLLMFLSLSGLAQEVSAPKSKSWDLTGRVQVQHLFDNDTESDAARTNNGFRIRRGRFQISSHLNDNVSAKFQIEVRDNSPNLKDAEAKVKILKHHYLRFGQFKVPVWREELRSSGSLLLVERSAAAEFLADSYLSARHVGLEFGGKIGDNVNFAANYSNGAGEGVLSLPDGELRIRIEQPTQNKSTQRAARARNRRAPWEVIPNRSWDLGKKGDRQSLATLIKRGMRRPKAEVAGRQTKFGQFHCANVACQAVQSSETNAAANISRRYLERTRSMGDACNEWGVPDRRAEHAERLRERLQIKERD